MAERLKQASKLRVSLSFVCHMGNMKRIPDFVALVREMGVDKVNLTNLIPFGLKGYGKEQCYIMMTLRSMKYSVA